MVSMNANSSSGSNRRPRRFVISLSGSCRCSCVGKSGEDSTEQDCSYFNGYFEVTQDKADPDHYTHQFSADAPFNAKTLELRLNSDPSQSEGCVHSCVYITFGDDDEGNPVRSVAWGSVVKSIDQLGTMRRRSANRLCCWPHRIRVNPNPVPDYVTPQPEWMPGNPDDLNHAPFWPSLDFDLMEDSEYAPVRYANGELQLRIKDLGSEAFGIPWGHTRIYSNRLSNSHDYGNGTNWMLHEWPRLVRFNSPINIRPTGVARTARNEIRTGCTIAFVRGTRNALWFDEFVDKNGESNWKARFNAHHVLERDATEHLIRIYAPNGHTWEFFDFTCPASREFQDKSKEERDAISPSCLKRHIGPYGEESQEIAFTYKNCQLEKMERSALGGDQASGAFSLITETFTYRWKEGRVEQVTLSRKLQGEQRDVSRARYTYYGENEDHGCKGDLKTVQIETWKNGWTSRRDTLQYYAYFTDRNSKSASNSTYVQGMLRAVVGADAYHRMKMAGKDPLTDGPDKNFSDLWIEYYSDEDVAGSSSPREASQLVRRIKSICLDRGGRTFGYEFELGETLQTWDAGQWFCRTTEIQPSSTVTEVISNAANETQVHNLNNETRSRDLGDRKCHRVHAFYRSRFGQLNWIATPNTDVSYVAHPNGELAGVASRAGMCIVLGPPQSTRPIGYVRPVYGRPLLGSGAIQGVSDESLAEQENSANLHAFYYRSRSSQGRRIYYLRADNNPQCNLEYAWAWSSEGAAGPSQLKLSLPPVPRGENGGEAPTSSEIAFNQFGLQRSTADESGVTTSTAFYDELSVPKKVVVRSKEGENLVTDIQADQLGRITRVFGPIHRSVTDSNSTQTERIRRATWTIFDDVAGVVISASGFQRAGGGVQIINPVSATQFDRAGRGVQDVNAVVGNTGSPDSLRAKDFSSRRSLCRKTVAEYDQQNKLNAIKVYYDIQGDASFSTKYAYDEMYRPIRVVAPDETTSTMHYDPLGQPQTISLGVEDKVVAEFRYDNEFPNVDNPIYVGNLTAVYLHADAQAMRVSRMSYDWKNQLHRQWVEESEGESPSSAWEFLWDAAGRIEKELNLALSARLTFDSATVPKYDTRGQVYRNNYVRRSQLDPLRNDPVEQMSDLFWYDQSGNVIKYRPAGSLGYFKMQYDSLGRERSRFWGYNESPQDPFGNPGGRSLKDVVLEQVDTSYDQIGQPRRTQLISTGPTLQNVISNGEVIDKRTVYNEVFYDPLGRVVASIDYGTGQPLGGDSIPPATDYTLVTRFYFNERGELSQVTSPSGDRVTTSYDDAGRPVATVEADSRVPRRITRSSLLPDGRVSAVEVTDVQLGTTQTVARYLYGPQNAKLPFDAPNNAWVAQKIDADGAVTAYGYNRLGDVVGMVDARGVHHEYLYDNYGRMTDDIVTSFGAALNGVERTVQRISRVFDDRGRLVEIGTYGDAAKVQQLTSIRREYTYFDQVREETTYVGSDYRTVELSYASDFSKKSGIGEKPEDGFTSEIVSKLNTIRPLGIRYPYGRELEFIYGDKFSVDGPSGPSGNYADRLTGRVTQIRNVSGTDQPSAGGYASYVYWGQDQIYQVRLDDNGQNSLVFNLSFRDGRRFSALDTLGRLRTLRWMRTGKAPETVLQFNYQHRRNSQIAYRELREESGQVQQDQFIYDSLNRLDKFVRKGELAQEQSWSLDALGNWRKWDIRGSASGNLLQSRAHGPGDRIRSVANASKEASWAQPEYDQTGNLTAYPNPLQPNVGERVSYDAWNRPVSLTSNFTRLTYDGLGRLVVLGAGAEERRFTYTPDWRLLEEEVTPQAGDSYRHEYVWGIRGQDDLICREKYSDQGQLQERFYSLSDAQGNIVGVVPEASPSPDRIITYDPYGAPTGESDFRQLFGGYYYDSNTGLYLVRNRVYHPKLGRWLTKDPLGMVDGPNLYEYCAGDPVNYSDPSGGWIESAWDIASLGIGVASYRHNLNEGNFGEAIVDAVGITADLIALALPIIPGGAGAAIDATRAVRAIDRFSDVVKTADFAANAYQSNDAFQQGDFWGAGLGAVGFGARVAQLDFMSFRRFVPGSHTRWMTQANGRALRRSEYFRFRSQGYTAILAWELSSPYHRRPLRMGHHFVQQQVWRNSIKSLKRRGHTTSAWALEWFRDSALNVVRGRGMNIGRFNEYHARIHGRRHMFNPTIPPLQWRLPGGTRKKPNWWKNSQVADPLLPYGPREYLWFGSPTTLKVIGAELGLGGFLLIGGIFDEPV